MQEVHDRGTENTTGEAPVEQTAGDPEMTEGQVVLGEGEPGRHRATGLDPEAGSSGAAQSQPGARVSDRVAAGETPPRTRSGLAPQLQSSTRTVGAAVRRAGRDSSALVASGVVRNRCSARAALVARPSPATVAHHRPVTGVPSTGSRTSVPRRRSPRDGVPQREHEPRPRPDGGEGRGLALVLLDVRQRVGPVGPPLLLAPGLDAARPGQPGVPGQVGDPEPGRPLSGWPGAATTIRS